ncbi:DUF502 domain-containing protein [Uliginosibacterium sp. H3]|uniref:DUF502 domain-containing protein n=1 Tax=Uliginosibacterium silvisoli TaxID=3114758 RepID=A0ABU6K1B7_9RHOO|nr:DUF502 domain-containing protein [Uliginosibacterium sp. H3]
MIPTPPQSFRELASKIFSTFLAGLLAFLPFLVTIALLGWVGSLLRGFVGPHSLVGTLLSAIGLQLVDGEGMAYVVGALLLLVGIYVLGVVVQTRMKTYLEKLVERTIKRLPLIGPLYDVTDRFVGMFDRSAQADLTAMSPVWCFFGGEGGVAVLALMPNPAPIEIGGASYRAVLVPTAPIPVGGGLLYVPIDWVKPADIGVEQLTSIYLSMGLTQPSSQPGSAKSASV